MKVLIASCFFGCALGQSYEEYYANYTDYHNYTDSLYFTLSNDPYYQIQSLNLGPPEIWQGEGAVISATSVYKDYIVQNLFDTDDSKFWLSNYGSEVTISSIERGVYWYNAVKRFSNG